MAKVGTKAQAKLGTTETVKALHHASELLKVCGGHKVGSTTLEELAVDVPEAVVAIVKGTKRKSPEGNFFHCYLAALRSLSELFRSADEFGEVNGWLPFALSLDRASLSVKSSSAVLTESKLAVQLAAIPSFPFASETGAVSDPEVKKPEPTASQNSAPLNSLFASMAQGAWKQMWLFEPLAVHMEPWVCLAWTLLRYAPLGFFYLTVAMLLTAVMAFVANPELLVDMLFWVAGFLPSYLDYAANRITNRVSDRFAKAFFAPPVELAKPEPASTNHSGFAFVIITLVSFLIAKFR